MKRIEELECEYENYQLHSTFVTDLDCFNSFIEIGIDTLEKEIKVIQKERRSNSRTQKFIRLTNYFSFLFQVEMIDNYDEDNQILKEVMELVLNQKEKYERIHFIATNKNFAELTKLIDFSCEYYNQHIDYFESRRDALEYSLHTYYHGKYQNNIAVFNEFFDKKMSEYSEEKSSVKKKVK